MWTFIGHNRMTKPLCTAAVLIAALPFLAGCETVGGQPGASGNQTMQADKDAIDRALAKAAAGDSLQSRNDSLFVVERAYKRNPDDLKTSINYARALRQEGLGQRALLILKPHLADNPDDAEALTEFAAINLSLGRYQEAESAARKAVVEDPEMHRAYHVLGVSLDAQGFHKQAETAFRRGLEHWEGDPVPILNNLALSLAAQGYLDESLSILRRASASAPNRSEIERNLRIITALHQNMQGRSTQANTTMPEAGAIEPDYPPVPGKKPAE